MIGEIVKKNVLNTERKLLWLRARVLPVSKVEADWRKFTLIEEMEVTSTMQVKSGRMNVFGEESIRRNT